MIGQEASNEDMIDKCQQHVLASNNTLGDVDITILVMFRELEGMGFFFLSATFQLWQCIMKSVEWNKKEELVAEQAMKYLKVMACLFCLVLHEINVYTLF